eukprot:TRINITY_DN13119_c0_g1_i1.p1 TRINITY_DN13119_c0_g1~~TRINITY_DN13119_c0_g1_i1.p1  ORF type:complete len:378 (+),score=36.97 TRINITY_DN13119_c0_g1_i1:47-1180(+)
MYVDQAGAQGLRNYVYKSKDHSITNRFILGPIWDQAIHLFPMWLAPNLITLFGLALNLFSYLLVLIFNPSLDEACPRWVYLVIPVSFLIYQSLDNLDGRQARRTKSSSPLGELFDHGCDAITVSISGITLLSTLRLGPYWTSFMLVWNGAMLPFYLGTLEEYHTGALILRQINGPIEGIILVSFFHLLCFFLGPDFWLLSVSDVFGIPLALPLNKLLIYLSPLPVVPTIFFNLYYIVQKVKEQNGDWVDVFKNMTPFLTLSGFGIAWLISSQELLAEHPHVFFNVIGILFALTCSKLIFSCLCHYKYQWYNLYLVPLIIGSLHSLLSLNLFNEKYFLIAYLIGLLICHFHFSYFVIVEFSEALNIRPFTVKKLDKTN